MQNEQLKPGHHTILSPAQVERFGLISEELGEGTQAVGKIFRHGFGAVDPVGNYYDNKTQAEKELGDVIAATLLSACAGELSLGNIVGHAVNKARKIVDGEAFLHHQPQELLDMLAVAIGDLTDLHKKLQPRRRVMLISLGNRAPTQEELDGIVQRFQNAEVDPLGPVTGRVSSAQQHASGCPRAADPAANVKQATMHEINAVVKSCIEDCDFMYPVRSGTKRFEKLLNMLRDEYGQHCVFDFPRRRDFHRAIDLQNWAVHCLVQNSLDMGGST